MVYTTGSRENDEKEDEMKMKLMEQTERGTYRIKVNHQPSGGREWVAEIAGTHPKFKFEREFLKDVGGDHSGSGKTGSTYYEVEEDKIYNANVPWDGRYFFQVVDGKIELLNESEVTDTLEVKVA
jgi:hypothetical protein